MNDEAGIDGLISRTEALAEATRLRLLRLLERHELGVSDLVDVLQLPQSSISRHLKLLVDRGWITGRSQGASNLYAMRPSEIDPGARRLWQAVRDQASGWPVARQDELRLARRLAERREASQAYFARSASRWDRLRRELYGAAFGDAALRGLLPRDWIVADLACGTGAVAAHLAPHVARVVAVDHSPAMLRAARKRVAGLPNVDLRTGELERLPLETACCDAVLLLLALSYVSDPALALAEAARVSKPAGRLVVVDLLRHDREDFRLSSGQQRLGFDPEEMTSLVRSAGFSPDHSAPLPPEPEAKGPALLMTSAARTGAAVTPGPASPRAGRGDKERKKKS